MTPANRSTSSGGDLLKLGIARSAIVRPPQCSVRPAYSLRRRAGAGAGRALPADRGGSGWFEPPARSGDERGMMGAMSDGGPGTPSAPWLTERQQQLVRESFAHLQPVADAAASLFYF